MPCESRERMPAAESICGGHPETGNAVIILGKLGDPGHVSDLLLAVRRAVPPSS